MESEGTRQHKFAPHQRKTRPDTIGDIGRGGKEDWASLVWTDSQPLTLSDGGIATDLLREAEPQPTTCFRGILDVR